MGFPAEKLEVSAVRDCQELRELPDGRLDFDEPGRYVIYELPHNASGFLEIKLACFSPLTLYVSFDELLMERAADDRASRVDCTRLDCANAVRYDLGVGRHSLRFFEPYTMKYLRLAVVGGTCAVEAVGLTEYKHPPLELNMAGLTPELRIIGLAALETFRQNAVDLFTDCPSRERAGWLCDSYFSGRVEYALTGGHTIERAFLENFLHEKTYTALPEGMVPMCYPADHYDGWFTPNWALWLLLELDAYRRESGDADLPARFRGKVSALLRYFERFENEDGLLEKLDGWVFIEWSRANKFVQDVNYPTNMLYAAALAAVGRLYGDEALLRKADRVRSAVLVQSFDGEFFVDNARRVDGRLERTGMISETCQYYAFFFKLATPDTHTKLFERLLSEFGPQREATVWPQVCPSAPFIGNYLCLDICMQYGYRQQAMDNIVEYFLHMAQMTGTLWEHEDIRASCCHGFASYVLYWLATDL